MNLWEFSLSVYGKSGVPDACLTLQNSHGLDVNLVLFCLWLATDSRCLAGTEVKEAIALSDAWRQKMISPLRALRTEMKAWPSEESVSAFSRRTDFEELRNKVKAVELEAEKWQQQMLTSLVGRYQTSEDDDLVGFSASLDLIAAQSKNRERARNELIIAIADAHSDDFGKKVRSVLSSLQSNR